MWRGVEQILLGRDPRDAWSITQRFCGVCTTVHAIASVRAVENALDLPVPMNAQYIRNLMISAHAIHDEIVHFYHLSALDWVDVTSALKADPVKASQLGESLSNVARQREERAHRGAREAQDAGRVGPARHLRQRLLGPPGDEAAARGEPARGRHYLQALEVQRKANKIVAILGSKTPHIQNVAVGGVSNPISLNSQSVLTVERLLAIKEYIDSLKDFINNVYLIDVAAVAAFYPEWTGHRERRDQLPLVPRLPDGREGHEVRHQRWLHGRRQARERTSPSSASVTRTSATAWPRA
jgi:hydrogenase large subunit